MKKNGDDDPGYEHVPRGGALLFFEQLAKARLAGKAEFPDMLRDDLLRAYLELLGRVREMEGRKSKSQERVGIVNQMIAMRFAAAALKGPISKKQMKEILAGARSDVADASGTDRDTVKREHARAMRGDKKP